MVTTRINGFIVKRVLVGLKIEDFSKYDTPLVEFDGWMVVPEGQISFPVNIEGKEVMVNFIVVAHFLPLWLYSAGHGFMR